MLNNGMSSHIAQYCTDNWRSNTIRNYQYKLFDWIDFNKHVDQDPYKFSGEKVMDFLVYLFESKSKSASSVRAAYLVTRSLCNAAGCQLTRSFHRQIVMLLNGMYSRRPGVSKPRKDHIWDVSTVIDFLSKWDSNSKLSLLRLGAKLACLIMLTTMRRQIDLCQLDVKMISWNDQKSVCTFHLPTPTKTCNLRTKKFHAKNLQNLVLHEMRYDRFSPRSDLNVCPIRCLKEYIRHTATLRQEHTKLFIITCEPFSPAKSGTLCRWVKMIMDLSGIDVSAFGPHSIRSATSSKAWETGVSLDSIMKRAGWSSQNTFIDHYLRDIKRKIPLASGSHDFITPMPPITHQHGVIMEEKIREDQNLARKTKKCAAMWDSHQVTSPKPCTVSVVPSDSDDETLSASPQPLVLSADISCTPASVGLDLPSPPLLEIPDPPPLASMDLLMETTPLPPPLGWEDPDPSNNIYLGVDSLESTSTSPPSADIMPNLDPPIELTCKETVADPPPFFPPLFQMTRSFPTF